MSNLQGSLIFEVSDERDSTDAVEAVLERTKEQWKNLFSRPSFPTKCGGTYVDHSHRRPRFLTRRNQRENQPWGDILAQKARHTRIYVQNVNGFQLDRRGGQMNGVCKVVQETRADIFCGQEHNLR
jgi:hypothetical protein